MTGGIILFYFIALSLLLLKNKREKQKGEILYSGLILMRGSELVVRERQAFILLYINMYHINGGGISTKSPPDYEYRFDWEQILLTSAM